MASGKQDYGGLTDEDVQAASADALRAVRGQVSDSLPSASSFDTDLSIDDADLYRGWVLMWREDTTLKGESSVVDGVTQASDTLEVEPAFSQAPSDGDRFYLYPMAVLRVLGRVDVVDLDLTSGSVLDRVLKNLADSPDKDIPSQIDALNDLAASDVDTENEQVLTRDLDSISASIAVGSLVERIQRLEQQLGHLPPQFFESFDAQTLSDLETGWTTQTQGSASISLQVDELPSAVRLDGGGTAGDTAAIESQRTVSLEGRDESTIVVSIRAKVNREDRIDTQLSLRCNKGDRDEIQIGLYNSRNWGTGSSLHGLVAWDDGTRTSSDLSLKSNFDLTAYHEYRLEVVPGGATELFVDGVSQGTVQGTPTDQSFVIKLRAQADSGENVTARLDVEEVQVSYE
jgi:hypothetical protein